MGAVPACAGSKQVQEGCSPSVPAWHTSTLPYMRNPYLLVILQSILFLTVHYMSFILLLLSLPRKFEDKQKKTKNNKTKHQRNKKTYVK